MTKEEKYEIAIDTIYNTLKERQFIFSIAEQKIIRSILKYIETFKEYVKD